MKNTQKPQTKKQFSAKPAHSRSASHRNLAKLGRITSSEDVPHHGVHHNLLAQTQRPLLNRSRSTESTISRRNNRSFTKLSALQPLTRTRSHQHVPRVASKVVIDLHTSNESPDDDNYGDEEGEEEEVDTFSDDEIDVETHEEVPLREPSPEPIQHLSYRAPPQFSHRNADHSTSQSVTEGTPKKSLIDSDQLAKATAELSLSETAENDFAPKSTNHSQTHDQAEIDALKDSSSQELAQYYQNMILSQSTGLVRQFSDTTPFHNSLLPEGMTHGKQQEQSHYIHSNDHISGTITNGKPLLSESTNSLKQFTIQQWEGSHESHSMLSFKAEPVRRDRLAMTAMPSSHQLRDSPNGTPNLSQFLRSGPSNIETRTQQKLWLQRENSLLDISVLRNTNTVTPQVRREFERVSRDFTNVRRFVNPLSDAVKRANVNKIQRKNSNQSAVTPLEKIKAVNTEETQATLLKLWIQADHHQPALQTRPQPQRLPNEHQFQNQQPQQRPTIPQQQSAYTGGVLSAQPRASQALPPTTRAVDRANQSPENKRIDLAAIRHPEEQVQKLS